MKSERAKENARIYRNEYRKAHYKGLSVHFNLDGDADVINILQEVKDNGESVNAFIVSAMREYLQKVR